MKDHSVTNFPQQAHRDADIEIMDTAIRLRGLTKTYGTGSKAKTALKGIDLDIPKGSFFGLLGPNGAGKSTLINILAGLVNKTAGEVTIWGHDDHTAKRAARQSIGVVPQELVIDPFFTPQESLEIQAGFYGVPKAYRQTEEILKAVGLWDKREAYARSLSGGMKRRLMVAKALVHRPPILILDEPTAGVDVELRQQLWAYVRDLNAAGTTIVLTTHYLEEAETLCDNIAIIHHGDLVACASPQELKSRFDKKQIRLTLTAPVTSTNLPQTLQDMISDQPAPDQILLTYTPSQTDVGEVLGLVQSAGLMIKDITTLEPDLEDAFLALTR